MDLSGVKQLVVYHLDKSISTPFAVLPEMLNSLEFEGTDRFEFSDSDDFKSAYEALISSTPIPTTGGIDARWGIILVGENEEPLLSAYTDSFGVKGMINGKLISFKNPAFLRWLERRCAT